jgi:hypothetical protein
MGRLTAVLWFVVAFLAGAGLFLATRPRPVLHALVQDLKGTGLIERCRQAGACGKPQPAAPPPRLRQTSPPDMDRA